MKYLNKDKHMAVWKVVIADILLVGVILVVFAFFHHVLPAMISRYESEQARLEQSQTEPTETQPEPTQTEPVTDATEETEPSTEPDNRTEWQKKFEDHFTDEVVITDHSYSSPEVSVTIETVTTQLRGKQVVYYVADIYVASLDNFKTYPANGQLLFYGTQPLASMMEDTNAILAVSGDFLTYQQGGFLVRNGEIYTQEGNYNNICVLYEDGTMETLDKKTYDMQQIMDRGALQVWSFGPPLLDEYGEARERFDVTTAVSYNNPRSAIGYYEPGHYCLVVVDGRQKDWSDGMLLGELAAVFQDLGCTAAYNLDGGGTAVMGYRDERYSRQSNGQRDLGDIIYVTDSFYTRTTDETEGTAE